MVSSPRLLGLLVDVAELALVPGRISTCAKQNQQLMAGMDSSRNGHWWLCFGELFWTYTQQQIDYENTCLLGTLPSCKDPQLHWTLYISTVPWSWFFASTTRWQPFRHVGRDKAPCSNEITGHKKSDSISANHRNRSGRRSFGLATPRKRPRSWKPTQSGMPQSVRLGPFFSSPT